MAAIEADSSTPEDQLYGGGGSCGDWTSIINYPLSNNDSVFETYGISSYPTIYLICQDRSMIEIDHNSISSMEALAEQIFINTCPPVLNGLNATMSSYDSDSIICGDNPIDPVVTILNMGTDTLTSFIVQTILDDDIINTYNWSGSISSYESTQIQLNQLPNYTTNVSFNIVMTGDVYTNDNNLSVEIITAPESHSYIHVEVNTDFYPVETSWDIRDASDSIIISHSYEGGTANGWNAGGPDADITHDHFISLLEGCYTFNAYDSWGDGQTGYQGLGTEDDGSISVKDTEGLEIISITGDWGMKASATFNVTHGFSVNEITTNSISIYPSPASGNINLTLNLFESDEVFITIINTLGKTEFKKLEVLSAGQNIIPISVDALKTGMYHVNIFLSNELITNRFYIIK